MKKLIIPFLAAAAMALTGCKDHDDPELAPIDTSKVTVTADITVTPSVAWLNPTEEITVTVANVEMSAPKGVVLRNINLMIGDRVYEQKPFAGETLEFKMPLNHMPLGRLNLGIWGDIIKKECRDDRIIIADNIQRIIFSETPEFQCDATVDFVVKSKSTSGEEYEHTFQAKSIDHFTIAVPADELYWTPQSGTASTLDVTMTASAKTSSTNSTLESKVTGIYWTGSSESPVISLSMPNTPGIFNSSRMIQNNVKLGFIVETVRYGTWENITITESPLIYSFSLKEI